MEDDDAAVSKVFGDDDLLAEILLLVVLPTNLVRAAAVCKRWLHHVSDAAFLRRFRKLNPPRLLGFYIQRYVNPRFVPILPLPADLAAATAVVGGYSFGAGDGIQDSRNGSVFTIDRSGDGVISLGLHSPLCPHRAMAIDPPLLPPPSPLVQTTPLILSREEQSGALTYFYVSMEIQAEILTADLTVRVFMLRDGVWCTHTSATTQIPHWRAGLRGVVVGNKIYMMVTLIDITVLVLTTSSISTIQLPQRVRDFRVKDFMISQADDASGVYLVGLKDRQLGIWLHKGNGWSIVDTICLHEMLANLMMSDCRIKEEHTSHIRIHHVGDNAEFVLLNISQLFVLYLDMRCRTLRTLYEMPQGFRYVHPITMIWPPTFPKLKYDPNSNVM